MNLSAPFIQRPIATALLMFGVLLAGIATYPLLPVAALPNVNFPTIQISAQLPGANPQTMASSIATPLEQQLSQIPGVTQLTSTSALGVTTIIAQFELSRSIESASVDVLAAINAASPYLPQTPYPPTIRKVNPAVPPVLLLALTSDTLPLTTVDAYAENILIPKISQVPGVGLVGIGGQQKPAIRIQVDPQALAARNISLEDVRAVIGQANVNLAKGTLNSPRQTYTLSTNDQLLSPAQYDSLIITYRNGSPVRIRDIGTAVDGPENDLLAGWFNHNRAIVVAVQQVPGANVIETVDRIKKLLPTLEASIPPGIKLSIASDRTTTIRAAVADVQFTLVLTIVLVVMVIFIFLRNLWATIIPAITVPLALIGTFAALYLLGGSLDNLSLMALSIAVGFVVDDAVVVIENIVRHIEEGLSPMEAAMKGSAEIAFTIVSITLSLIAVFIPLFLMPGYVGKLFHEFALTISVSLVLSLIISLTLTPMMCARLLRSDKGRAHGRSYLLFERTFDAIQDLYARGLTQVMRHHFATLIVMFGTIGLTGWLYIVVPKSFFPQEDTGLIQGITEASEDISFAAMSERQQAIVNVLLKDPAVENVSSYIGPGGPTATLNQGRVFIVLKPESQRSASADEIIARLKPRLANIQGIRLFMQSAQDITVGARLSKTQYQYTLTDADADELSRWADIFLEKLKQVSEITDVASDQANAGPLLNIEVNRDAASTHGILPATIDNTLDDAFGQRIVSTIYTSLNQYHVILEVAARFQYGPEALNDIYLGGNDGQQVPLSTLVRTSVGTSPIVVNHQNLFPSVTISFNLRQGAALGDAVRAIADVEKWAGKPKSLSTAFQGNAQAFETSLAGTPMLIGLALIVIYLILGILYESLIHPLAILSTLPSAGIGALLMLMAVKMSLSVIAIIGIILLIGIVKKNGIMLVDFAIQKERSGQTPEQAIYQACIVRFRPILMTTMAALLGGVPLMLGSGTGSELRQPLGYTIVGGLILSQMLTLFTTPVVYVYLGRLRRWRSPSEAIDAVENDKA
ncbi:efflux RND transporter permease subunit [Tardiphaga sp. 866_E4_N2_1]|uniref:efflux RND transporter permease subunit n=1 Tax=unclassified Tardiphaga TaxID=2631404 RepID=UPI003F21D056